MSDATTRLNAALEGRYAIERELGGDNLLGNSHLPGPRQHLEGLVRCVTGMALSLA